MSDRSVPAPPVPDAALAAAGYEFAGDETEVGFDSPFVTVAVRTQFYDDPSVAAAVPSTAADRAARAFFVTRCHFRPGFERAPVSPASVVGFAANQACREFLADLRESGLRDVDAGPTRRYDAGDVEGRLFEITARYPVDAAAVIEEATGGTLLLPVEVLAAIRPWRDTFLLAGAAYPTESLAAVVDAAVDADVTHTRSFAPHPDAQGEARSLVEAVGDDGG
ncbi:hypothetical protein [Halobaculum limi]|uniref:hypothetical protein n=1 Tax=Halobaculum limi TaxID=3031916 RepID=UPI0024059CD9|nr:hypothetical protein [Halobaculum sp. YSMS11]